MPILELREFFVRAGGGGAWALLWVFAVWLFASTRFQGSIWFIVGASSILVGKGAAEVASQMGMALYGHWVLAEVLSWHDVVSTIGILIFGVGFIRCAIRIRRLVVRAGSNGWSSERTAEQDAT